MHPFTSQISRLSDNPSWPVDRVQPSKPTARLRSACDACHEAKTKCLGGGLETPCRSCQEAQKPCTYSLGRRLGRPKGSKNKRKQGPSSEATGDQSGNRRNDNDRNPSGWDGNGRYEQFSSSQSSAVGSDFERAFDTAFLGNRVADYVFDDSLNLQDPASFVNALSSMQNDLDSLSAQTPSFTFTQPTWGIETSQDSVRYDSTYAGSSPSSTPNNHSRRVSTHAPPTAPDLSGCTCLQQQVRLVYQLGDLQDFNKGGPSVDRVLQCVELAQEPWQNLMQCEWCHNPEYQKEVFLLFATSIRILLSSIRRLESDSDPRSNDATPRIVGTTDGRTTPRPSSNLDVDVSVGSFKLTGETRTEIINVVLRRAMRIVTSAMLHLKGRVGPSILKGLPSPSANTK